MTINRFYLSENIELGLQLTDLSLDEIESIVGRFANHSRRAGKIRGEVIEFSDGVICIRHHFTKKILWSNS